MDVLQLRPGAVERLCAHEDAGQRVVVALREGVEGMIVAAGAGEREPEHRLRHHVDLLIDEVHLELPPIALVEPFRPEREEARGNDLPRLVGRSRVLEQVAGDLGLEEVVVGHVVVEGFDDPIAVAPRMRKGQIRLLAARFGVAGDVEPVPGPTLAETRRREQPVDDPVHRRGGGVGEEVADLPGLRRQPGEVERQPAEEGFAAGVGHRLHSRPLHFSQEEAVDVTERPGGVVHRWHLRRDRLVEGPVVAAGLEIGLPGVGSGLGTLRRGAPEGREDECHHGDPCPGQSEPSLVRHRTALMGSALRRMKRAGRAKVAK